MALALPGILPTAALAQAVADHGILELKYLGTTATGSLARTG